MYEDFTVTDRWTGEPLHCLWKGTIVAIATRHADATDIRFAVNGKPVWIAMPNLAWVEQKRRTGKVITDYLAAQTAGRYLKSGHRVRLRQRPRDVHHDRRRGPRSRRRRRQRGGQHHEAAQSARHQRKCRSRRSELGIHLPGEPAYLPGYRSPDPSTTVTHRATTSAPPSWDSNGYTASLILQRREAPDVHAPPIPPHAPRRSPPSRAWSARRRAVAVLHPPPPPQEARPAAAAHLRLLRHRHRHRRRQRHLPLPLRPRHRPSLPRRSSSPQTLRPSYLALSPPTSSQQRRLYAVNAVHRRLRHRLQLPHQPRHRRAQAHQPGHLRRRRPLLRLARRHRRGRLRRQLRRLLHRHLPHSARRQPHRARRPASTTRTASSAPAAPSPPARMSPTPTPSISRPTTASSWSTTSAPTRSPSSPSTPRPPDLGPPALFSNDRPGSGPRHIAFHPNGRWVYSINEIDSTIDHFLWTTTSSRTDPQGLLINTGFHVKHHRPQLPRRKKHRRRSRHLRRRQLPLRLQPRRRLARRLHHRRVRRRAHLPPAHPLRRQDPAPLHPLLRLRRTLAALRQPGLRHRHRLPPRRRRPAASAAPSKPSPSTPPCSPSSRNQSSSHHLKIGCPTSRF